MENIPDKFKSKSSIRYPSYVSGPMIEEYFYKYFNNNKLVSNRTYLPIFWTNYYIINNWGKNINDLKEYIKNLDRNKKYFTIVQHCRGILCDVSHLDILIFSAGGAGRNHNFIPGEIFKYNSININIGDIPIPLLANPELKYNNSEKNILCSFMGEFKNDSNLRNSMYKHLHDKQGFLLQKSGNFNDYYNILCKSIFSLCPRGIGITSFRLYESLQCLAIPIYIYDDIPWLPYQDEISWNKISIIINENDIHKIPEILEKISINEINDYQNNIKKFINLYFTLNGTCQYIYKKLNKV